MCTPELANTLEQQGSTLLASVDLSLKHLLADELFV